MANTPKLAIFDIDGTIATHGKVPSEIFAGFKHLHDLGCATTVSTGRGYIRLRDILGKAFETLISPATPIIVEHGTKIVDTDGTLIFGDFFTDIEIEHAVDFIRANIGLFKLAWFNPVDVTKKVEVWCANEADVQAETAYRKHYAHVFSSSLGELNELLLSHQITNITLKLKDYVKVENLKLAFTRTATNVIFQDGNMEFVKANTNKGLAVLYAARENGVAMEDMLLAGNAINDVEMLDLGVGTTILVSSAELRSDILSYLSSPENVVTVNTPEDLGRYLSEISRK